MQVTSVPEMDQQAEKPESEEQQTVEDVLDTDTISKVWCDVLIFHNIPLYYIKQVTDLTSGEEAEIVEIVLDPDTICKVFSLIVFHNIP